VPFSGAAAGKAKWLAGYMLLNRIAAAVGSRAGEKKNAAGD